MASQSPYTRPETRLTLRLLLSLNVCFTRVYHRLDVLAPQRLPRKGPAILVSNHTSALDPLLIQAACPRPIVWMMAKEYYEIKWMKPVFQAVEAIPVDRGKPESSATRSALRALAAGRILGIFPEAKWETSRALLPFQTGVALLAMKTKARVFPAFLDGTQRYKEMTPSVVFPNHASVTFGGEVMLDRNSVGRDAMLEATRQIEQAVDQLRAG